MAFILFTLIFLGKDINLKQLDLYSDHQYSACRYQGSLFIASEGDNSICKLDKDGQTVARFDKSGPGPKEIEYPCIVGANKDGIVILNRRQTLLFFDHSLNILDKSTLTNGKMYGPGFLFGNGQMALTTFQRTGKHFGIFSLEGNKLLEKRSFGDTEGNMARDFRQPGAFSRGCVDNLNYFIFKPMQQGFDAYDIQVFKYDTEKEEMTQGLLSDISHIQSPEKRLVIISVLKLKKGYLVQLVRTNDHFITEKTYLDHYDLNGGFRQRETLDSQVVLVPVLYSDEDLVIDTDLMIAHFIEE